MSYTILGQSYR